MHLVVGRKKRIEKQQKQSKIQDPRRSADVYTYILLRFQLYLAELCRKAIRSVNLSKPRFLRWLMREFDILITDMLLGRRKFVIFCQY